MISDSDWEPTGVYRVRRKWLFFTIEEELQIRRVLKRGVTPGTLVLQYETQTRWEHRRFINIRRGSASHHYTGVLVA